MFQKNNLDFHAWNIKKDGTIEDQLNKEFIDLIALFNLGHIDYKLIYKKWDKLSPFYEELKEKKRLESLNVSKDDKIKFLKTKEPFKCLNYASVKKELFHYDIEIGSLGLQCNKTNKIHWEYGNGKSKSVY